MLLWPPPVWLSSQIHAAFTSPLVTERASANWSRHWNLRLQFCDVVQSTRKRITIFTSHMISYNTCPSHFRLTIAGDEYGIILIDPKSYHLFRDARFALIQFDRFNRPSGWLKLSLVDIFDYVWVILSSSFHPANLSMTTDAAGRTLRLASGGEIAGSGPQNEVNDRMRTQLCHNPEYPPTATSVIIWENTLPIPKPWITNAKTTSINNKMKDPLV